MFLLSALMGRPFIRSGLGAPAGPAGERRDAPRFNVHTGVSIVRHGLVPVPATVTNLSQSGAAIRGYGWHVRTPQSWPIRLRSGDEVALSGILGKPIDCWVVNIADCVMRVHFAPNDSLRIALRQAIEGFEPLEMVR